MLGAFDRGRGTSEGALDTTETFTFKLRRYLEKASNETGLFPPVCAADFPCEQELAGTVYRPPRFHLILAR